MIVGGYGLFARREVDSESRAAFLPSVYIYVVVLWIFESRLLPKMHRMGWIHAGEHMNMKQSNTTTHTPRDTLARYVNVNVNVDETSKSSWGLDGTQESNLDLPQSSSYETKMPLPLHYFAKLRCMVPASTYSACASSSCI